MSVLRRAARRDIAGSRRQYLGVGLTVFIGVALFAASYDAYLNLETSYRQTYERLAFADLTVTGGDTAAFTSEAIEVAGVVGVTTRREADVPIRLGGDHVLLGRIVELPDDLQPAVGRVDILAGSVPAPAGEWVMVERHLADHFDLHPGSTIDVRAAEGWVTLDLAASVASPEYLWPARSRQDLLTSADDFGVLFAARRTFDTLVADATAQVLVRYDPNADAAVLTERLSAAAFAHGAATVEVQADQPSNAALQEDVAGFGELSFLFPVLFLGTATMATFILLSRLVRAQQVQIATLRANGMSTRRIAGHYLGQGVAITAGAGAIGLLAGVVAGRLVTGLYTEAISVPDTVTEIHVTTIVTGLALSVLAGAGAAAAPAIAAARTDPGVALRGSAPVGNGGRSLVERVLPPIGRLPARWRMMLRGIGRDRRRSISTAVGVVLALTLILASWGMVDTVEILLDRQFETIQRQDAELHLSSPDDDAIDAIARTPGVARVESTVQASVVVSHGSQRYATELIAFEPDTRMHDFGSVGPPGDALVAGRSLAELLGVGVGDTVTVAPSGGSTSIELPVAGFVDEPLGTFVYTGLAAAESFAGGSAPSPVLVQFASGVDRDTMRSELTTLPGVVAYADSRALYQTAQSLLSLFYVLVGVMLAFGSLMAFALIFNTTTVNAAERATELAAMRVNGVSSRQLARMAAGENLLLTALSIAPGLLIGRMVSAVFMGSFSSDLFDFDLEMRTRTLVLSALAVLSASALAQWPAARTIASLDVARVVRERSR